MSPESPAPARPLAGPWRARTWWLAGLLVLLALPDLLSPPISPTILRQTQTFSQTQHFVAAHFSLTGLTIDIDGPRPFPVVYEFPLYQAVTGLAFMLFGPAFFWGKLVSLLATLAGFALAWPLACRAWGVALATRAGFFFVACPITLLVGTAFQPDAFALALGAGAAVLLAGWREQPSLSRWMVFLALLLAAALAKFTVLVPFLPLLAAGVFRAGGRWRALSGREWLASIGIFAAPFVAWNLHRATLMDPRYLAGESATFFVGNLGRFFHPGFYAKPAFILGAMVLCGAGIPLVMIGWRGLSAAARLLAAGVPLYYLLIPTAAEQTYYAWPLVPAMAVLAAHGWTRLEQRWPSAQRRVAVGITLAWLAGFAIAAPYTLRHDDVSLAAARSLQAASPAGDFVLVANMHDRGVGMGGFNPTIFTLAERRGWNLTIDGTAAGLRREIERRRREGARWVVLTWFTPDLEPWFARFLPASFSRCPRLAGVPVDGRALATALAGDYPRVSVAANFMVLQVDPAAP